MHVLCASTPTACARGGPATPLSVDAGREPIRRLRSVAPVEATSALPNIGVRVVTATYRAVQRRHNELVDRAGITSALVADLIADQFPQWADLVIRPVDLGGWDNVTFRLGPSLTVRLPSAAGYVPQVDKEHRWLPILGRQLRQAIPQPVARGRPGCGFPRPWSVYRWIDGVFASGDQIDDLAEFARALAAFLMDLQAIDATDGPAAGPHSGYRGGLLDTYDAETRAAIEQLADIVDADAARDVWNTALATTWNKPPVWVHGDVTAANLLITDGQLGGVLDFGCCAVGDPACDLVMAWTYFTSASRDAFRDGLDLDEATWARGRGWALWKALITMSPATSGNSDSDAAARRFGWRIGPVDVIDAVIADHEAA